jgi:cell division protein FtsB
MVKFILPQAFTRIYYLVWTTRSTRVGDTPDRGTNHNLKHQALKRTLLVIGVAVLVTAGSTNTYALQHRKLTETNTALNNLNNEVKQIEKQVTDLQAGQSRTTFGTNSSKSATQNDLNITIVSANRINISSLVNKPHVGVAVDMNLTNPTSTSISLVTDNLERQDLSGNVYKPIPYGAARMGGNIPSWDVLLQGQVIAPHKSVRGALF